jgi:hypothetical protein
VLIETRGGQVRFQILDWKAPEIKVHENLKQAGFDKNIDYIIASDVIYNSSLLGMFPKVRRILCIKIVP